MRDCTLTAGPAARLPLRRPPRRPGADDALHVTLDDPRPVRIAAVHDELHLGIADREAAREVGGNDDDPIDPVFEQQPLRRAASIASVRDENRATA